jgi:hypothetical protein
MAAAKKATRIGAMANHFIATPLSQAGYTLMIRQGWGLSSV